MRPVRQLKPLIPRSFTHPLARAPPSPDDWPSREGCLFLCGVNCPCFCLDCSGSSANSPLLLFLKKYEHEALEDRDPDGGALGHCNWGWVVLWAAPTATEAHLCKGSSGYRCRPLFGHREVGVAGRWQEKASSLHFFKIHNPDSLQMTSEVKSATGICFFSQIKENRCGVVVKTTG